MRLFVAIEIGAADGASKRAPDHLTLEFLGETDRGRVPEIVRALEPVGEEVPSFDLTLEGVGAFPAPSRPRVVWVGAGRGRAEVVGLARRVIDALVPLGMPAPRESFEPHLTLFRVRTDRDRSRAMDLLAHRIPPPEPRTVRVDRFLLKESELDARGAIHRTIASFALRGPGAPSDP